MSCGPETVDVPEAKPKETSKLSRGFTKHTGFPRSLSISILLYTKSQRNEKIKRTSYENT